MPNKNQFSRYAIAIAITSLCFLCPGCTKETPVEKVETAGTTIGSLIEKYSDQHDKEKGMFTSFEPIYNVDENQGFELKFNALPEDLKGVVTVYRDEVKKGNEVKIRTMKIEKNRETYLVIRPDEVESNDKTPYVKYWGGANGYYIVINYDTESPSAQKLDFPSVIYFTVANETPPVHLNYKLDSKSNFSLQWDKVHKASQYRVYEKTKDGELVCVATTQSPEYTFGGENKTDGLVYTSQYVTMQNNGVAGEYFVTALFEEKESNFSNGIKVSDIGDYIPQSIESNIFGKTFENLSQLPQSVKIKTLNGKTVEKKIIYDFEHVNQSNLTTGFDVNYAIQDTELTGYVQVTSATVQELTGYITLNNYNETIKQPFSIAGNIPLKNTTTKNYSVNSVRTSTSKMLLDLGAYKLRYVADLNASADTIVPDIPSEYKINASNLFEEYLARYLFNHEEKIDLSLFPEAHNEMYLNKTMKSVIQNNPLILGVASYDYDCNDMELHIAYHKSEGATWMEKQNELMQWVKQYLDKNPSSATDTVEKETALYDFLIEVIEYDYDALDNARENWYESVSDIHVDSFNAYGTLVKQLATPAGYASAFKLLCDYRGIECNIVSGTYKGIPHVWNVVCIDGNWMYVDVSNNYISSGIPYPVFNIGKLPAEYKLSPSSTAIKSASETTAEVKKNNQDGYYESGGLAFASEEELYAILDKQIKEKSVHFVLKNNAKKVDDKKACELIAKHIHEMVPETEFLKYFIGIDNDFIVISKTE